MNESGSAPWFTYAQWRCTKDERCRIHRQRCRSLQCVMQFCRRKTALPHAAKCWQTLLIVRRERRKKTRNCAALWMNDAECIGNVVALQCALQRGCAQKCAKCVVARTCKKLSKNAKGESCAPPWESNF
ncbi:MAG: hypothetical protein GY820_46030 [Gammaproteobacteria bacterium]|nr:hypothetical protein [Gammaproteobacteria bacterium]